MKLTQKIAREYIRLLGGRLKRNVEYDEYRVIFGKGDNEEDYFCSDLEDAIGTARIMKGGHPNIADAEEYLALMVPRAVTVEILARELEQMADAILQMEPEQ